MTLAPLKLMIYSILSKYNSMSEKRFLTLEQNLLWSVHGHVVLTLRSSRIKIITKYVFYLLMGDVR